MADHQFRQGVATAIRAIRAERRWTQRELCRQTELSPAYLSELESGQKDASADVLERIADAFGFRMDEFLWIVLLAMTNGEVPNVERRESAFRLMQHALAIDPATRADLDQFVQFQQWKQSESPRNRGKNRGRSNRPTPEIDRENRTQPDFTEDA
jgi:transcriptional regulator with XRE-family HTH domain